MFNLNGGSVVKSNQEEISFKNRRHFQKTGAISANPDNLSENRCFQRKHSSSCLKQSASQGNSSSGHFILERKFKQNVPVYSSYLFLVGIICIALPPKSSKLRL